MKSLPLWFGRVRLSFVSGGVFGGGMATQKVAMYLRAPAEGGRIVQTSCMLPTAELLQNSTVGKPDRDGG